MLPRRSGSVDGSENTCSDNLGHPGSEFGEPVSQQRGARALRRDSLVLRARFAAGRRPAVTSAAGLIFALHSRLVGPFGRKVATLSALTAVGQMTFVAALPVLSRMYTPTDFGVFA